MVIQMLSVIITMVLGMAFILIYRAFSVLALGIYQGDYRWKSLLEIIFTGDRSENVIVRILFIFIICCFCCISIHILWNCLFSN